jgi:hypothetical protein
MFTKEDIEKMAGILKVPAADLQAIHDDKEAKPITFVEGVQSFTADELNTFQKNKYDSGKNDGVAKLVKDAATANGLDFKGATIDGLLKAYGAKALADADKNPDQRVQELSKQIETLKGTVTEYEGKITAKDSEIIGMRDSNELYRHVPRVENGPEVMPEEIITVMKMRGYDFKRDSNGVMQPYKSGQLLADKLGTALPIGDVVKGFMKEARYITEETVPGGRGGSDSKKGSGGKPTKMSEAVEQWQAQGKSISGEEFAVYVEGLATEKGSTFKMNE